MNIFRIFFVSTVLIPVLVVVVTSDESGIRIRRPRSIVISEDGTRTARRHNPVNITDKNCPALGCTGNLTTNEYNGKGSLASTLLPRPGHESSSSTGKERRFVDSSSSSTSEFHHDPPLKLEIKSIKNSTRSDLVDYNNYIVANDHDVVGAARGLITYAIFVSWAFYWTWKIILTFMLYFTFSYFWGFVRKSWGIGDDYIEYYVKLGKDEKHPFGGYGKGWNPTFGVSLKSKVEEVKHGWKGWSPHHGQHAHHHHQHHHHASSYHDHGHHEGWSGWPEPYYAGWQDYGGWPGWDRHQTGWPDAPEVPKKGWKSESEEEEDELKHKFDMRKGWKIAKKYTKKYGKKAHKYGLRPSKYSYMFDDRGNIILGGKEQGYAWRRRSSLGSELDSKLDKLDESKLEKKIGSALDIGSEVSALSSDNPLPVEIASESPIGSPSEEKKTSTLEIKLAGMPESPLEITLGNRPESPLEIKFGNTSETKIENPLGNSSSI